VVDLQCFVSERDSALHMERGIALIYLHRYSHSLIHCLKEYLVPDDQHTHRKQSESELGKL